MTRKLLLMRQLLAEQKMKAAMEANAKKEAADELKNEDVPGVNILREIEETTEDSCHCECKETCECEDCCCKDIDECSPVDDTAEEEVEVVDTADINECPCLSEPEDESVIPDAKFVPEEVKQVEDEQPAPKKKRGRAKKSK